MTPILYHLSLMFICIDDKSSDLKNEVLRDCNAIYYPFMCILSIGFGIVVILLGRIIISTSFTNFFKEDALDRLPAPIDYQLINLRIVIIVTSIFTSVITNNSINKILIRISIQYE